MKFGLSCDEYKFISEVLVVPLQTKNLRVFCFGSRARGSYGKFSDLDLMIEGKKNQATDELKSLVLEKISKSNFPYKVDLVFLEDFSPAYQDNYQKERLPW